MMMSFARTFTPQVNLFSYYTSKENMSLQFSVPRRLSVVASGMTNSKVSSSTWSSPATNPLRCTWVGTKDQAVHRYHDTIQ